jgi:hypothetical protein
MKEEFVAAATCQYGNVVVVNGAVARQEGLKVGNHRWVISQYETLLPFLPPHQQQTPKNLFRKVLPILIWKE